MPVFLAPVIGAVIVPLSGMKEYSAYIFFISGTKLHNSSESGKVQAPDESYTVRIRKDVVGLGMCVFMSFMELF